MQDEELHKYEKYKTIKSKAQAIANTKEFVLRFEPSLYVLAFTTMKDFTIYYWILHKGTLQQGITTTGVHNSPTHSSRPAVAQSQ